MDQKTLAEAAERVRQELAAWTESVERGERYLPPIYQDELLADIRALLAHYDASRWRPIADAKKDGRKLLLARFNGREPDVIGVGRAGDEDHGMEWSVWFTPTHFRPLPAPPEQESPR